MTAPKKKPATKAKTSPKTGAKKKATPSTTKAANVPKTALKSDEVADVQTTVTKTPQPKDTPSMKDILDLPVETFKVGTANYAKVVKDFNSKFARQYNFHRVPPYVFRTMVARLKKYYEQK